MIESNDEMFWMGQSVDNLPDNLPDYCDFTRRLSKSSFLPSFSFRCLQYRETWDALLFTCLFKCLFKCFVFKCILGINSLKNSVCPACAAVWSAPAFNLQLGWSKCELFEIIHLKHQDLWEHKKMGGFWRRWEMFGEFGRRRVNGSRLEKMRCLFGTALKIALLKLKICLLSEESKESSSARLDTSWIWLLLPSSNGFFFLTFYAQFKLKCKYVVPDLHAGVGRFSDNYIFKMLTYKIKNGKYKIGLIVVCVVPDSFVQSQKSV